MQFHSMYYAISHAVGQKSITTAIQSRYVLQPYIGVCNVDTLAKCPNLLTVHCVNCISTTGVLYNGAWEMHRQFSVNAFKE